MAQTTQVLNAVGATIVLLPDIIHMNTLTAEYFTIELNAHEKLNKMVDYKNQSLPFFVDFLGTFFERIKKLEDDAENRVIYPASEQSCGGAAFMIDEMRATAELFGTSEAKAIKEPQYWLSVAKADHETALRYLDMLSTQVDLFEGLLRKAYGLLGQPVPEKFLKLFRKA